MSERFTFNGIEIEDNKKGIEYNTFMKESCEKITNQLNELVNENKRLKREIDELDISIKLYDDDVTRLLNENKRLQEEKEHYRKYALLYITDFDLYSNSFIESMQSIYGDEFASKLLKDREEIEKALKMEGLYE